MKPTLRTPGASARAESTPDRRGSVRAGAGFTLLELCIVLFIIAVLAGASLPAFQSAVNEHKVREDGHLLALFVRRAMVDAAEQHRPYVIDLGKSKISLHPQGEITPAAPDLGGSLFQDATTGTADPDAPVDIFDDKQFDDPNKLQEPNPDKAHTWMDVPDAGSQWVFQPGELCPATTVRIVRDNAYLEMSFEPLTGQVMNEKSYFP